MKLSKLILQGVTGYGCTVNMGMTAYSRLFAHEILPTYLDRILYIDCDTIICGGIMPLFQFCWGASIGMAYDCIRNNYKAYIDHPANRPYYNSGVIIMDINKWREHHCMDRIWEHISHKRSEYPFVDQDFLNVVIPDEICAIPMKYNVLSPEFLYSYNETLRIYGL